MIYKSAKWNGTPVPYDAPIRDLEEDLKKDGGKAAAAFQALAYHLDPQALDVLKNQARSLDWRYRRLAIEAISIHPFGQTCSDLLIQALTDSSQYVVRTACDAVARLRISAAHDILVGFLSLKEDATRCAAVRALSEAWQEDDFERLLEFSKREGDKAIRLQAAWTLRRTISRVHWRELFELWRIDETDRHRVWACELAGTFGPEEVVEELEYLTRDVNGHVRKAASRVLLQRGNPRITDRAPNTGSFGEP